MIKWIRKLFESSVIRYIFFGGCTTLVNLISFYILRRFGVQLTVASRIVAMSFCEPRS